MQFAEFHIYAHIQQLEMDINSDSFYLKLCCVNLCTSKGLHLANSDITILPLQIRNSGYSEVAFRVYG